MAYENGGFKPGVSYLSGAVVKEGELLVYYGASDSYVCVASCGLGELLTALMEGASEASEFSLKGSSAGPMVEEEQHAGNEVRGKPNSEAEKESPLGGPGGF